MKKTTTTTVTDRALTIRSNIRGCQSCTTWSAGQEKYQRNIYGESSNQRENENKTKQKQKIRTKKGTITQSTCQKKNRRALDRRSLVGYSASARHPITLPGSQPFTQTYNIYLQTLYFQGVRFLPRHSRRRLGSPWVGPINAAPKRLKLATVTPGATSTWSASFASLFLCRCSDTFSSSFTNATINL